MPSPVRVSDYLGTAETQLACALTALREGRQGDAWDYICGARSDVLRTRERVLADRANLDGVIEWLQDQDQDGSSDS